MAKVKITSNPYQQQTEFFAWNAGMDAWEKVSLENNPNSRLPVEEFTAGFFPFKAKKIVDVIVKEYYVEGEKVEIIFEGTDDEYEELSSVCSAECYQNTVELVQSERGLENARDILEDIIDVFNEIKPLIDRSVKDKGEIQWDLDKFTDASSDYIPICVIGNYSSGKSTFINALIGYELLPSSDEPTTAKIYRIEQSSKADYASIALECEGQKVEVTIRGDKVSEETVTLVAENSEAPLCQELRQAVEECAGEGLVFFMSKMMEIVNSYASGTPESVSDIIKVITPFDSDGIWGKTPSTFVILDTPGSNSASNAEHLQVLHSAMENMSNGLPVFVTENDSLDSTDNDKLYQDINNMQELDKRFTMIIVNKADSADLRKVGTSEEDRRKILSLAIPRRLYSGGIYYVSSIMGIGSKNDEEFINDHSAEIFEDQKNKYGNPRSRFYKQLFFYDILPDQIRRKYEDVCLQCENRIYANSGLYSVEQAIDTFATRYSSYNKCCQSQHFLEKVIQFTAGEIQSETKNSQAQRDEMWNSMEKNKRELLEQLEQCTSDMRDEFSSAYHSHMKEVRHGVATRISHEELKKLESQLMDDEAEKQGVHELNQATADAVQSIFKKGPNGFRDFLDRATLQQNVRRNADKTASEKLFEVTVELYIEDVEQARVTLQSMSDQFWKEKMSAYRDKIRDIVMHSQNLDEQEQNALASIIAEYRDLEFENPEENFFTKAGFFRLYGNFNRLNLGKLAGRCRESFREKADALYHSCMEDHEGSFLQWEQELRNLITSNIVEYNPELHEQAEDIRQRDEVIADLKDRQAKLEKASQHIRKMMDWRDERDEQEEHSEQDEQAEQLKKEEQGEQGEQKEQEGQKEQGEPGGQEEQ